MAQEKRVARVKQPPGMEYAGESVAVCVVVVPAREQREADRKMDEALAAMIAAAEGVGARRATDEEYLMALEGVLAANGWTTIRRPGVG